MKSRKFIIAIIGMSLIALGLTMSSLIPNIQPIYGAFVTGICSVAALYKAGNVAEGYIDTRKLPQEKSCMPPGEPPP